MPNHSRTYSNLGYTLLLAPLIRTADANSTSVDLQDSDDVTLMFSIGAIGDTMTGSNKLEVEVQESDDNSTFTAVADADLTKTTTGTNTGTFASFVSGTTGQNSLFLTGYKGGKRYIRGVANFSGTITNGSSISLHAVTGMNRNQPINT